MGNIWLIAITTMLDFDKLPLMPSSFGVFLFTVYAVFIAVVHLLITWAVFRDARRLLAAGSGTFLIGPFLWGAVTLITGIAGFALYWVVHHSTLRRETSPVTIAQPTIVK